MRPTEHPLLDARRSAELRVRLPGDDADDEELLGYLGEVSAAGLEQFELRSPSTVAELKFATLLEIAELVPKYHQPPMFPAVSRDLNLVVDESVRWAEVAHTVRRAAAPFAEALQFRDEYRDAERLGTGKKSLLFTLTLRSPDGTLTNDEADRVRTSVVEACATAHGRNCERDALRRARSCRDYSRQAKRFGLPKKLGRSVMGASSWRSMRSASCSACSWRSRSKMRRSMIRKLLRSSRGLAGCGDQLRKRFSHTGSA